MDLQYKIVRHPSKQQLLAYAETLVDRRSPAPLPFAKHVNSCPQCGEEVKRMRASLTFVQSAPELAPSEDFSSRVLLEARKVRSEEVLRQRKRSAIGFGFRAAACAAGIALLAGATFGNVLRAEDPEQSRSVAAMDRSAGKPAPPSREALMEKASDDIKALSTAVRIEEGRAYTLKDQERLRAVSAIGEDIAAAKDALERNPGCTRASDLVQAHVQRGADTLRELYVEQTF